MKIVAAMGIKKKDIEEVNQQVLSLRVRKNPKSRIFNLRDSMDDSINQS